jgi:hypothetical protein
MPCQGLAVGSGKFCRMEQGFCTIKRSHLPRQPFLEWVHVFQGGGHGRPETDLTLTRQQLTRAFLQAQSPLPCPAFIGIW